MTGYPHSIYNIAGKVVWSIKKRYDQIYWCVNRSQLYATNQHLFLFRFRLKLKINPLELHDNKLVTLKEFFEGLEISSATNILHISVENDRVTLSADRLGNRSFSLIPRISLQTLKKIYTGYLKLRLKTCGNVKSVIVWNVSFRLAFRSF